jgi:hypothetical protein
LLFGDTARRLKIESACEVSCRIACQARFAYGRGRRFRTKASVHLCKI